MPHFKGVPGGLVDGFALWVRMLFSCLVDADFLDTEAHFDAGKPARREGFPTLGQMHQAFDGYMASLKPDNTPVNTLRADILRQCRAKAALPAGFFSLTVPTGGGKTLSSLAFALNHAQAHDKRRIIYAIPYTSIIEQTADVFRGVFKALGDEVRGCPRFCVNGQMAGNCRTSRKMNHDRKQRIDRPATCWLQKA